MIVNQTDTGWDIIFQPAHALLSTQLAGRWKQDPNPPRWWDTLVAVAQHDNGWQEWEQEPKLTEAGQPMNFINMPPPDAIAQWERGIARGRHQSRWVGLLISCHATSLYSGREGEVKVLDEFLERQKAQQKKWQTELGVSDDEVAVAYRWIRFFDWLSLVLCWQRLPTNGSPIELGIGPDGVKYEARAAANQQVTISPYPFTDDTFDVNVEVRTVHQRSYTDPDVFKAALWEGPSTVRTWTITHT